MVRRFYLLVMIASLLLADVAPAGILFNRKPKPSPQRAQELLTALLSDASESKRAAAAEELGDYDAKTFPEIVPGLLQALRDSGADVRASAVQSLGKLRPVSQEVGQALEQAQASDSSMKVRLAARTTLWGYGTAGYRAMKGSEGPKLGEAPKPTEPAAVAKPMPAAAPTPIKPMFAAPGAVAKPLPAAPTVAQPMPAAPVVAKPLPSAPAVAKPLPAAPIVSKPLPMAPAKQEPPLADPPVTGPASSRLVPVPTPQLQAPTPSVPRRMPATPVVQPTPIVEPPVEGPSLNPPM